MSLSSKIFVAIFCYISAVVRIGAAALDAMNQPIFLVAIALTRYRSKVQCERGPS
jgi:hypothetical protein